MKDARNYPRVKVTVPLYIALERDTFRKDIQLESKDISGGGVSFETSRRVPLNAKSRVVVYRIGDLAHAALIRGRVAYRHQDRETGRYVVGVEFTDFVHTTREELLVHLAAWTPEPPRK